MKFKFKDLPEHERKFLLTFVRFYNERTEIFKHLPDIGYEKMEEIVIKLLEDEWLVLRYDEEKDAIWIEVTEKFKKLFPKGI